MSMVRRARLLVPAAFLLLSSISLSAQAMGPRWHRGHRENGYVEQSMRNLLNQTRGRRIDTLTGAQIRKALDELSVARQKEAYVRKSELASLFVPGAGQFLNHAPATGALFLGGDLAVAASTLVGAYFLLPSQLQFGQTNYITDSFSSIKTKWMSYGLKDYLPSAAVFAGGMILDHVIRHLAAENAGKLAQQNIKEKKVTFKPEPFLVMPGPFGPRVGFGWMMRF